MKRALVVLGALVIAACATPRSPVRSPTAALPSGKRCVYVPIFVDQTDGSVSPMVTDIFRERLYEQAPGAFAMEFAEECVAVDGAVVALDEAATGGVMTLVLRVSASLTTREGEIVDLGHVSSTARFEPSRELSVTELRRYRALRTAAATAADELLRRAWTGPWTEGEGA
jgi:hypothetical protein